jgi:hypothetical protein
MPQLSLQPVDNLVQFRELRQCLLPLLRIGSAPLQGLASGKELIDLGPLSGASGRNRLR